MIYQLPNGKIIHLSIEEYLDLTDQDIQHLMSVNAGDHPSSPWQGSILKKQKDKSLEDEIDKSIDYTPETDELVHIKTPKLGEDNQEEDFLDLPDEQVE